MAIELNSYRIYFIDANRHISRGEHIACADDDEAIRKLRELGRGAPGAELWQGGRPVAHIAGDGEAAAGLSPAVLASSRPSVPDPA